MTPKKDILELEVGRIFDSYKQCFNGEEKLLVDYYDKKAAADTTFKNTAQSRITCLSDSSRLLCEYGSHDGNLQVFNELNNTPLPPPREQFVKRERGGGDAEPTHKKP